MHLRPAVIAVALLTVVGVSCSESTDLATTRFETTPVAIEAAVTSGEVTINADVAVSGTVVRVERSGTGADAEASVDLDDQGVLRLGDDCEPTDDDCTVDFAVDLRGEVDVDVVAAGGRVTLTDVVGVVTIDSGGGDVSLISTAGSTQVTTNGGQILATRIVAAEATFETQGGDADVTFDDPVDTVVVATDGGKLTLQAPGGPYAIDADTEGGSLDVLVDESADSSRTLTLRSGGGDITVYRR